MRLHCLKINPIHAKYTLSVENKFYISHFVTFSPKNTLFKKNIQHTYMQRDILHETYIERSLTPMPPPRNFEKTIELQSLSLNMQNLTMTFFGSLSKNISLSSQWTRVKRLYDVFSDGPCSL